MSDPDYITIAEVHGAKLHRTNSTANIWQPMAWVVLDQNDNDLWHRRFLTKRGAARAYCEQHGLTKEGS